MSKPIPLVEFFHQTLILGTEIQTLEQAVGAMLHHLSQRHLPASLVPTILEAVLRREKLGSTGIGGGVAIPHARVAAFDTALRMLAIAHHGIDANSLDAEPVSVIILLLAPPIPSWMHLGRQSSEAETMMRLMRDPTIYRDLREAQTEEQLWSILTEHDRGHPE